MFRFSSLACKSLVKFTTSTSVAFDQAGLLGADWQTLDLMGKAPMFNVIQIGECLEKLSPLCSTPHDCTSGTSLGYRLIYIDS